MADRFDDAPRPLPREWLPAASAPEDAPEWKDRAARIVAAAEPALHSLENQASAAGVTVASLLGSLWKPAAAILAAAAALLVILDPASPRDSGPGWSPLSIVAAAGEPFALWEGLGIEADPVLALIALEGQAAGRTDPQDSR